MIEAPAALLAQLEDISEELFARVALDENVLLGGVLVAKTRRNGHALYAERHHISEKGCHFLRRLALKQSAVNCDPEPPLKRLLNCLDGLVKHSVAANGGVVADAITVQMNRKCQVGRRDVILHPSRKKYRVGAQINILLPLNQAADNLRHFFVDQGLAPGNGNNRSATLVDCGHAVRRAQPAI